MAERIDTIVQGRPSKYPWEIWTDGSKWRIQRGHDYDVLSSSMSALIRSHALRYGLTVVTSLWQDGDGVEFQFIRDDERQAA